MLGVPAILQVLHGHILLRILFTHAVMTHFVYIKTFMFLFLDLYVKLQISEETI